MPDVTERAEVSLGKVVGSVSVRSFPSYVGPPEGGEGLSPRATRVGTIPEVDVSGVRRFAVGVTGRRLVFPARLSLSRGGGT